MLSVGECVCAWDGGTGGKRDFVERTYRRKNHKSDIKRNKLTVNQVEPNAISYNAFLRTTDTAFSTVTSTTRLRGGEKKTYHTANWLLTIIPQENVSGRSKSSAGTKPPLSACVPLNFNIKAGVHHCCIKQMCQYRNWTRCTFTHLMPVSYFYTSKRQNTFYPIFFTRTKETDSEDERWRCNGFSKLG